MSYRQREDSTVRYQGAATSSNRRVHDTDREFFHGRRGDHCARELDGDFVLQLVLDQPVVHYFEHLQHRTALSTQHSATGMIWK